jgi:hypothetical protein
MEALRKRGGIASTHFDLDTNGVEWSVSSFGCAVPQGKDPLVPIELEAGWAPEQVWTQRLEEKSFAPARDQTPVTQTIVRHYTD